LAQVPGGIGSGSWGDWLRILGGLAQDPGGIGSGSWGDWLRILGGLAQDPGGIGSDSSRHAYPAPYPPNMGAPGIVVTEHYGSRGGIPGGPGRRVWEGLGGGPGRVWEEGPGRAVDTVR